MTLLEAVRQVLRIEIVPLLIRLIYTSIPLVTWIWKFDDLLLINIWSVLGIFSFVVGRALNIIKDHWESLVSRAIAGSVLVVLHILLQKCLSYRPLNQWFKIFLGCDERSVP